MIADQVIIELQARVEAYNRNVQDATQRFDRSMSQMESRARSAESTIGGAMKGFVTVATLKQIADLADTWTRVGRALASTESVFGVRLRSQEAMAQMARETRSDLESLTKLYTRTAAATRDLGVSEQTVADVASTVAKSLKLGSATAEEQASVMLQLSQAFQKGKLDGDEFRSVMENASIIQEALARHFNVTGGAILKMSQDGKLTVKDLVAAIAEIKPEVDKTFGAMPATIGEAFTQMKTDLTEFVAQLDQMLGLSGSVVNVLSSFGQGFKDMLVYLKPLIDGLRIMTDLLEVAAGNKSLSQVGAGTLGEGLDLRIGMIRDILGKRNKRIGIDASGERGIFDANAPEPNFNATFGAPGGTVSGPQFGEVGPYTGARARTPPKASGKLDEFQRDLRSARERTDLLKNEMELIGATNGQIEARRMQLTLEQAAIHAGLPLDEARNALIEKASTDYGILVDRMEELKLSQDQLQQASTQLFDIMREGFLDLILHGRSFSDVIGNILLKLAEMAASKAFMDLLSPGGAGGIGAGPLGSIFGTIAKFIGFAQGGVMTPSGPRQLKRFDRGGVSRETAIFGESGSEAAVPLPDGRRIPVDLRVKEVRPAAAGRGGEASVRIVPSEYFDAIVDERSRRAAKPIAIEAARSATQAGFRQQQHRQELAG